MKKEQTKTNHIEKLSKGQKRIKNQKIKKKIFFWVATSKLNSIQSF